MDVAACRLKSNELLWAVQKILDLLIVSDEKDTFIGIAVGSH